MQRMYKGSVFRQQHPDSERLPGIGAGLTPMGGRNLFGLPDTIIIKQDAKIEIMEVRQHEILLVEGRQDLVDYLINSVCIKPPQSAQTLKKRRPIHGKSSPHRRV